MTKSTIAIAAIVLAGTAAFAETTEKTGKTATGETCKVMVEKHPDGRVTRSDGPRSIVAAISRAWPSTSAR